MHLSKRYKKFRPFHDRLRRLILSITKMWFLFEAMWHEDILCDSPLSPSSVRFTLRSVPRTLLTTQCSLEHTNSWLISFNRGSARRAVPSIRARRVDNFPAACLIHVITVTLYGRRIKITRVLIFFTRAIMRWRKSQLRDATHDRNFKRRRCCKKSARVSWKWRKLGTELPFS